MAPLLLRQPSLMCPVYWRGERPVRGKVVAVGHRPTEPRAGALCAMAPQDLVSTPAFCTFHRHREVRGMHEYNQPTLLAVIAKAVLGVITWTGAGALLGGAGGLLFGTLFGAIQGLIHLDPWRLLSAGYFALCGVAAGALVGTFTRIFDGPHEYAGGDWPNEDFRAPFSQEVDFAVRGR